MAILLVVVVVVIVGYLISIRVHPFTTCRRCNGTNRHKGAIYTYSFRKCRRCDGTGRKLRLGARMRGPSQ
jgi:DnaJ-class molecular chaperone